MPSDINFFAETTFRHERKRFGIKLDDRRKHMYLIGKTGMGKTNMMANMAIQDIQLGHGIAFVDPHGETADSLLDYIPQNRINDVIYFDPGDLDFPIAFNVMEKVDLAHRHLVASGLMGVFKKIWPDVWSARMEYILNNAILALLEYPGSTLLGVNRMLSDPEYRQKVVEKITDPVVKAFWLQEYARYTQRYEVEATAAIQNKVGQFISAALIRNIIGQVSSKIDMRDIMDTKKILIMNLAKGRVGEDNSMLLGALLITKLQLAAMSRVDIPEEKREDFFLYVDEFQNFATESFATILSEARKYRLDLVLGHQYINQMEEEVRDAVFGNVGSLVVFRIGAEDAEFLEREFTPEFLATDLVNLAKYNIYLRLMIDGLASRPFSAQTLPPIVKEEKSNREKIIKTSRERYSNSRQSVEDKISRWTGVNEMQNIPLPPKEPMLYDAQCAKCKKWTKVVFKPDGKRPVYCKNCLKEVQRDKEGSGGPVHEQPFHAPEPIAPSSSSLSQQTQPLPPPSPPSASISLEQATHQEPASFKRDKSKLAPETGKIKEAILEALKSKDQAPGDKNVK
ncbi:MAG: type IV secretion system DNA-binding domain-containing protein [bacterium]|nr:type IV secretion system DNA-binding domain-containing protein [bacterium]